MTGFVKQSPPKETESTHPPRAVERLENHAAATGANARDIAAIASQSTGGVGTRRPAPAHQHAALHFLQRTAGNAAVSRLFEARSALAAPESMPPRVVTRFEWDEGVPEAPTLTPREAIDAALASKDAADVKRISNFAVATPAERLDLIDILVDQWWAGPFDEAALEVLWNSFGVGLAQAAGSERGLDLWKKSLDKGAELDNIAAVRALRDSFGADVKAVAGQYLSENREYVSDELLGLRGGATADPDAEAVVTANLQADARLMGRALEAQAALRQVQVGYDWESVDGPGGVVRTTKVPATFAPGQKPMMGPNGNEEPKLPSWEDVDVKYQEASDVIRGLAARSPALYSVMNEGTAAKVGGATPEQARAIVSASMAKVLTNIDETLPKLDNDDLDWRDLRPIHAELFAAKAKGYSGVDWKAPFNKSVAEQVLADHESREFWVTLGLGSLAAAAFVVAELATAGTATFFIAAAVGVAASGLQAGMSWEQYEDLATAEKTQISPERSLVTSGQASAALLQATLDTLFLFLDVYGVAAKGLAGAGRAAAKEALEAGERKVGQEATKEAGEMTGKKTTAVAEEVAEETLAAEAQASIRLGEATHTLKAVRRNGRLELWLCSNCERLLDQIAEVLPKISKEGDSRWAYERLAKIQEAAIALQERINAGEIPFKQINGEVNQLAERLRNLFAKFPKAQGLEFFKNFKARPDFHALAERLGFQRTSHVSHGQPVYQRGNRYISPDIDGHKGGVWKVADDAVRNLRNREMRTGTFNEDLTVRVDD